MHIRRMVSCVYGFIMHKKFSLGLLVVLFFFQSSAAFAADVPLNTVTVSFDAHTILKNQSVSSTDSLTSISILSNVLREPTDIDLKQIDSAEMQSTFPKDLSIVGSVYLFDLSNKKSYDGKKDLLIDIRAPSTDNAFSLRGNRSIYFFNGVHQDWEILPSVDDAAHAIVHAKIRLPYARIAVFEDSTFTFGKASWYSYKHCNCTASPDFPKGTKLRVTNIDAPKKFVIVKVNDFGPDRAQLPDRILDLDKVAFKKLAKSSAGVIRVKVEVVK